jgi:hypothetical protein
LGREPGGPSRPAASAPAICDAMLAEAFVLYEEYSPEGV